MVVHNLARTYNRLPSEILDLDPFDLSFCVMCYQEADQQSALLIKKLNADGMPCFPTIPLR